MASDGHGPSRGPGRVLYWIGRGICPDCKGDLAPGGESSLVCPRCDRAYPVGRRLVTDGGRDVGEPDDLDADQELDAREIVVRSIWAGRVPDAGQSYQFGDTLLAPEAGDPSRWHVTDAETGELLDVVAVDRVVSLRALEQLLRHHDGHPTVGDLEADGEGVGFQ